MKLAEIGSSKKGMKAKYKSQSLHQNVGLVLLKLWQEITQYLFLP